MEAETVAKALNTSTTTMEVDYEAILEPVPLKYGISVMLLSVFFFELTNKLITSQYPKSESENFDFWKWKNLAISWVHAGTVALWCICSLYAYGKELFQDLIAYHNYFIYCLLSFTTGYFLYDFMDIWRNNYAKKMWEVLVHHVSVTIMFFYNVAISRCIAVNTVTLVVEINSFFLHTRKLIQLQNPKMNFDNTFYRMICWMNLITFVLFRFGTLVVIYYSIYMWGHRVSRIYLVGLWASCIIFQIINMVLFWRLVKSDIIKYYSKKRKVNNSVCNNNVKDMHSNVSHKNGYVQNGHISSKEKSS